MKGGEFLSGTEKLVGQRSGDHLLSPKRAPCSQVLLLNLLLLVFVVRGAEAGTEFVPNFRGIAPQDVGYFQTSVIQCRDGSKSFPRERLNDDFCDCVDGTDEPGTSACSEGKFYCKNLGDIPVLVFSSRVNDGICDCCDGSDEDGIRFRVLCPNTCQEESEKLLKEIEEKVAARDGKYAQALDQGQVIELRRLGRDDHHVDLVETLKQLKVGLLLEIIAMGALIWWLWRVWLRHRRTRRAARRRL